MEKDIKIIFHNLGLRSYIEVDLCAACPRQDDKGCCGYYSPVFYPTDLAYLYLNQPDLLDHIFSLEHLTILDASVTVNNVIEGNSYRCKFHRDEGGCFLSQSSRESICRHFVCPGIGWWKEAGMQDWRSFFDKLTDYEYEVNNRWTNLLKGQGLTLRETGQQWLIFNKLGKLYQEETAKLPAFIISMPDMECRTLSRPLRFGLDWQL